MKNGDAMVVSFKLNTDLTNIIVSFNFHSLIFSITQRWVTFPQIFQEHRKQNWSEHCQKMYVPFCDGCKNHYVE